MPQWKDEKTGIIHEPQNCLCNICEIIRFIWGVGLVHQETSGYLVSLKEKEE